MAVVIIKNGVSKVVADVSQQANWNQSDSSAPDYIKNKPSLSGGGGGGSVSVLEYASWEDLVADWDNIPIGGLASYPVEESSGPMLIQADSDSEALSLSSSDPDNIYYTV